MNRRLAAGSQGTATEQGYMLLAVVVMLALIVVAAGAAAPDIAMSIRREREAELIHRGTQYMRAIQHYYKQFGRYPMRIEDLENTNNMRYLRRRYKDPITGKDFRLLHFGEVNMAAVTGMGAGAGIMGGAAAAALSGAFGSGAATGPGMMGQAGGGFASTSSFGANTAQPGMAAGMGSNATPTGTTATGTTGATDATGGQPSGSQGTDTLAGKVFGGGPIIGVVSTSHKASIREFNKKNHYNDWYFVYDPTLDRGGLVQGPAQPPLAGAGGSVVGTPGAPGANPAGGMNSGPGFGSSPSGNSPSGNSPFGSSPLQGPGAMVPAQPQAQPQQ